MVRWYEQLVPLLGGARGGFSIFQTFLSVIHITISFQNIVSFTKFGLSDVPVGNEVFQLKSDMKIIDLAPEYEELYFCCLEDWSDEI